MAGRHSLRTLTTEHTRVRVKVPLLSNWAVEYLKQLEQGNQPRLDHRARITVLGDRSNRQEQRRRLAASIFSRFKYLRTSLAVLALMSVSTLSWNFTWIQRSSEHLAVAKPTKKEPCDLRAKLEDGKFKSLTWLGFGGLETTQIVSPCDKKNYQVVREVATRKILRLNESSNSG